jgi:hypothetical protein
MPHSSACVTLFDREAGIGALPASLIGRLAAPVKAKRDRRQFLNYPLRQCALASCGANFQPRRHDQRYCRRAHYLAQTPRWVVHTAICAADGCGQTFETNIARAKYCSKDCYKVAKRRYGKRGYGWLLSADGSVVCDACQSNFTPTRRQASRWKTLGKCKVLGHFCVDCVESGRADLVREKLKRSRPYYVNTPAELAAEKVAQAARRVAEMARQAKLCPNCHITRAAIADGLTFCYLSGCPLRVEPVSEETLTRHAYLLGQLAACGQGSRDVGVGDGNFRRHAQRAAA